MSVMVMIAAVIVIVIVVRVHLFYRYCCLKNVMVAIHPLDLCPVDFSPLYL